MDTGGAGGDGRSDRDCSAVGRPAAGEVTAKEVSEMGAEKKKKYDRLLESKVLIPRILCFYVKREALCRHLEAFGKGPEKGIVLNAGAGFGKTMLLSWYAMEAEKDHCAWYSLDAMDNSLTSFAEYLTCSIQRVAPDFQFSVRQDMADSQPSAISLAYDFAVALMNASADRLFVILDDFQEIHSEEVITFLGALFDNTSDDIKFMIATKGAFPNFLLRYCYNGSVETIDTEHLSFTRKEIEALLRQSPNIREEERERCAAVLEEYSIGWPVGVMSVLLRVNQSRKPVGAEELKILCDERPANDYLMYEVFRKLPYHMQQFLTDTSALTVLSADLCNAALEISNAKATLDYLVKENLFVVRLDGSGDVYQYHSLFKSYLEEQLPQNRRAQICRRACVWSLRHGMDEQAAEYAMVCDDFGLVQTALERCGMKLFIRYEKTDLSRWQEYLERHREEWNVSVTLMAAEMYLLKGNVRTGRELTGQAEEKMAREEKPFSLSWYRVMYMKMEICLLMLEEKAAAQAAEQIAQASRSGFSEQQLRETEGMRYNANLVLEYEKLPENQLPGRYLADSGDGDMPDSVTGDWLMWKRLSALYRRKEDDRLEQELWDYLEQGRRENTYTAYIGYLYACMKIQEKNYELAASWMKQAEDYCERNQLPLPRLRPEHQEGMEKYHAGITEEEKPRRLEVSCFGEFSVRIEGTRTVIRWRTKKARELFAFLFDRRGREVSKDVISEALWPEMDPDSVSTLFYTTVSYVRKGLANEGYTNVILQKNRMYSLNMDCLVSSREQLEAMVREQAGPGQRQLVTELYHGPYLEGVQGDWFVLEREYYERQFLQICRVQAGGLMEEKRYKEAVIVLSGAVAVDEYDEQLSAMLIRCYGMAGDIKNARRQFERTERLMQEEMGMEAGEGLCAAWEEAMARCGKK